MSECNIPNCRNNAPSNDAFCARHRSNFAPATRERKMGDLYHGEYPVDMTPAEARAELQMRGEQQLLRNPQPHQECAAKAHEYVRIGDYRMAYFSMCEAYGKLAASNGERP